MNAHRSQVLWFRSLSLLAVLAASVWLAVPATAQPQSDEASSGRHVRLAWAVDLGAAQGALVEAVYGVGELVLAVNDRHGVSALRRNDGSLAWYVQLEDALSGPPTMSAGLVTFGSAEHVLVVDARSGRRVFGKQLPGPLAAAPSCDGTAVYAPLVAYHQLLVIEMSSGLPLWDVRLPSAFAADPLLSPDGVLVVASEDGLRGFVTDSEGVGRQRWHRRDGRALGRLVSQGSRVVLATAGREVLSVEAASGRTVWSQLPGVSLTGAPVLASASLAVGTRKGLLSLDLDTGRTRWEQAGEQPVAALGSMLIVRRADGLLATRDQGTGVLLDGGSLPEWQPLGSEHVVDVGGGSLIRVWSISR